MQLSTSQTLSRHRRRLPLFGLPMLVLLSRQTTLARALSSIPPRATASAAAKTAAAINGYSNSNNNNNNQTQASRPIMTEASSTANIPSEMTEDQRYLFDLNGFIVVRGVLSPEELQSANTAIDKREDQMIQRSEGALRNAKEGTKMYGTGPGRKDLGGVLEWNNDDDNDDNSNDDSRVFQSILAHPKLVPLFTGILGKGYRMDHLPFVLAQDEGAEGFQLHGGTIDCTSGDYNPHLAYTCMHGTIRSSLLGCNVMLTDHNPGDGGFCVVPGSHKSNFKMPAGMVDGEKYAEFIQQPATKAGDVVLFSEGTVHGALPWTCKDRQRRACLYRFAPATMSYGRSYFGHEGGGWPDAMYNGLTEAERSVLEPPYANRLDRPNIKEDGSVELTTRSARKRQHDQDVFGTKYF